ncbi:MAG: hypothetical protein ACYDEH_03480 [Acidimicrobiales bacterium]
MRRLLKLAIGLVGTRALAQRSKKWTGVLGGLVALHLLDGVARSLGRRASRRSS